MKKRTLILASTLTLIAALWGCGSSSASSPSASLKTGEGSDDLNLPASEIMEDNADSEFSVPPQAGSSGLDALSGGPATNSITVNSSEKVTVVPDIAQVEYSVRTQAGDAAACQQKNTESVGQVIGLLKSLNIDEASIQTSDYYMNPVYNYSGNTPRVTGYEAVTTLTVSDLPIDGLDEILAQSVSTGVNTIRSITYQASKYDESYQQALTSAVEAARRKAEALADAAGCHVGSVINIQETSGYTQARYSDQALTNSYASARKESLSLAMEDSTSIMPGQIQVEASIVAEYQIY